MIRNLKYIILLFIYSGMSLTGSAQIDNNLNYSSFFNLNTAWQSPALLGLNENEKIQLSYINAKAFAYSNIFTVEDINSMLNNDYSFINDQIYREEDVFSNIGYDISLFNFAFKTNINKKPVNLSFGLSNRQDIDALFGNEFIDLAVEGNGSSIFRGNKVDLPVNINLYNTFEGKIGFSGKITNRSDPAKLISIGANLKFLFPTIGIVSESSKFILDTEADGKYVNLAYDLTLNSTIDPDPEEISFNFINGKGTAIDIGFYKQISNKLAVDISLLDIGKIKFDKEPLQIKTNDNFAFEGAEVMDVFSEVLSLNDSTFKEAFDEFEENINDFEKIDQFSMSYPGRLKINASYRPIVDTIYSKDKIQTYSPHTIQSTFIKGFNDQGSNTKVPYFAVRYIYNLRNTLEAGGNLSFGGINNLEMGMLLAVRIGKLRIGIGSKNLFTSLSKKSGKFDLGFSIYSVNGS